MRTSNRPSMLGGVLLTIVALSLNMNPLAAQTAANNKKTPDAGATEPETASKKNGGGTVKVASVNGTGTAGQIARWLDANTLESSIITQANSQIGISTTTPTSKLTVNGRVESLSGGFKFPDGTTQTTAFKIPLILTGAPTNTPLVSVNTTGTGNSASGVFSQSTSGNALHGVSASGFGVSGASESNHGTLGLTNSTSETISGVFGMNFGAGPGVKGSAFGSGPGVLGLGSSGLAGKFEGNVEVSPNGAGQAGDLSVAGNLSKASGSFKIDHPLDPGNKYLYHSFVESPDMMNIYNGNTTLDANGEAVVELPDWYGALNKDARYLLTPIGAPGPSLYIAEKIANNRFKIAGGQAGMEVSWQVTGIRRDAWADKHRIPVEEAKPDNERGFYLHPELFNQPEEKSVQWARNPEMMQQMRKERELAGQRKQQ